MNKPMQSTPGQRYYSEVMAALERYFACSGWEKYFLCGGCYWLAKILHRGIRRSIIMINRMEEHCALYFEQGLYDVTGKISAAHFFAAGPREIAYIWNLRRGIIGKKDEAMSTESSS